MIFLKSFLEERSSQLLFLNWVLVVSVVGLEKVPLHLDLEHKTSKLFDCKSCSRGRGRSTSFGAGVKKKRSWSFWLSGFLKKTKKKNQIKTKTKKKNFFYSNLNSGLMISSAILLQNWMKVKLLGPWIANEFTKLVSKIETMNFGSQPVILWWHCMSLW